MKNKVLVKLYVPELYESYDVFIPINEFVWKIKKIMVKSVSDLTNYPLDIDNNYILINKDTGEVYNDNYLLVATDIRNITELILVTK